MKIKLQKTDYRRHKITVAEECRLKIKKDTSFSEIKRLRKIILEVVKNIEFEQTLRGDVYKREDNTFCTSLYIGNRKSFVIKVEENDDFSFAVFKKAKRC